MPYTPDLDRLLTPGARFADEHATYVMEVHPVGDVVLPTGRVVGCDPVACPEDEPFTVGVAPGRYPARAWVAVVRGLPRLRCLPFGMLAIVGLIDFWASPDIIFRPMLVLGPAFASLWCGIRRTAIVGFTA